MKNTYDNWVNKRLEWLTEVKRHGVLSMDCKYKIKNGQFVITLDVAGEENEERIWLDWLLKSK